MIYASEILLEPVQSMQQSKYECISKKFIGMHGTDSDQTSHHKFVWFHTSVLCVYLHCSVCFSILCLHECADNGKKHVFHSTIFFKRNHFQSWHIFIDRLINYWR